MLRRGHLVRLTRGVYDAAALLRAGGWPAAGPEDLDAARRRTAWTGLLGFGPSAIAVGPSALALLDVQGLPRSVPAQVALPGGRHARSRDGLRVRCFDQGMALWQCRGRLVAAPAWALAQAVCELDRRHAVAVLDSALHLGLVADVEEVRRLSVGRRGAARTRSWWDLVDGRADSPLETDARLQCLDAGIEPDDLQVIVRDDAGRVLARGDLGWRLPRGRWLVAEIDGRGPHSQPDALYGDRSRQNAIVATGRVDVLRFTARDLARDQLAPTVRAVLSRPADAPHGPVPDGPSPRTRGSGRSGQSDPAQPPGRQPKSAQPPGRQPESAQPPGRQPKSAQPPGRQPKSAQPPGRQPKSAQPPGRQPESAQPPGRQPESAQPPGHHAEPVEDPSLSGA